MCRRPSASTWMDVLSVELPFSRLAQWYPVSLLFLSRSGYWYKWRSFTLFVRHGLAAVRHFGRFFLLVKLTVTPFTGKPLLSTIWRWWRCRSCSAGYRRLCGLASRQLDNFCRRCVANKMHSFVSLAPLLASDAVTVCSPKATLRERPARCQTHWYYSLPGSGESWRGWAECYRKIVHLIVERSLTVAVSVALSTPLPVISSLTSAGQPEPRFCPPQTLPAAITGIVITQRCGNRMRARFFTLSVTCASPLAWVMAIPLFSG